MSKSSRWKPPEFWGPEALEAYYKLTDEQVANAEKWAADTLSGAFLTEKKKKNVDDSIERHFANHPLKKFQKPLPTIRCHRIDEEKIK